MPGDQKVSRLHGAVTQLASWLKDAAQDSVVLQHKLVQLQQQKDAAVSEASKGALVRSKLEALCRELQAQNKAVLAESKQIADVERQKREQLSDRFLSSIKDVERRLGEQGDSQLKVLEDNKQLVERLHKASQEAELREKERQYATKKAEVEAQILQLKLKQQEELTKKERAERLALLEQLKAQQLEQVELHKQMAEYGARFKECQEMLAKSNQVMTTFKEDRAKMMGKVQALEKEVLELRTKSTKSDAALIRALEERNALKKQLGTTKAQKERLESLCRTLQDERKKQVTEEQAHAPKPENVVLETSESPVSEQTSEVANTPEEGIAA